MKIFNILDYGKKENITIAVKAALEEIRQYGEEATLFFPCDTYRFYKEDSQTREFHPSNTDSKSYPEKKVAFLIEDMENLTIDGNDSKFIVHGDMMFLACVRSKNIKFKNFTWDYPSPTTIEMHTKEIGTDYADFTLPKTQQWKCVQGGVEWFETSDITGEKYWSRNNSDNAWCINFLNLSTGELTRENNRFSPFENCERTQKLPDGTLRIYYKNGFKNELIRENSGYILCPNKARETCGAFFWESENISCEKLHPLYLHGFSWLVQMCKDITLKKCDFTSEKDSQRCVTSFADSLHVAGCGGKVTLENCNISHDLDDPINIHGTFMRVEEKINNNTLKLIYCHHQQGGFNQFFKGDKVVFFDRTSLISHDNEHNFTVKSSEMISLTECIVTFNEDLPEYLNEKIGDEGKFVAENITYTCDVVIRNCRFSSVPTRGILCTTRGKVLIENNIFDSMVMASIFISNDCGDWYESGPVRDMTIKNNKFIVRLPERGGENKGGILIYPITKGGKLPPCDTPIHKNITIENNEFLMEHDIAVNAHSVENLVIRNNVITKIETPRADKTIKAFSFNACKNVVLDGNIAHGNVDLTPEICDM